MDAAEAAIVAQIEQRLKSKSDPAESVQTITDESLESPAESAAESDVPEVVAETPDSQDAPESDNPSLFTLESFAKQLEMPEAELADALHVPGLDGKPVPLSQVLSAFRAPAPERVEFEKVSARAKELETADTDRRAKHDQSMGHLQQLSYALISQLELDKEPDWDALRKGNPAEYLHRREQWAERRGVLRAALEKQRAYQQEQAQANQAQFEEFRKDQARKLQAAVPEWSDPAKFRSDLEAMESYLLKQGFKPEEVELAADHRHWLLVRKAMLADTLPAARDVLKKRIAALPKMVRPGQGNPRSRTTEAQKAQDTAMSRLRKSGSTEDAAAAVLARFKK